ncbi:hypothetical protein ABZY10_09045 [Streptomyces sp. NPDC006539]|uniref:hypothetical protein n=1 Tax=Streptomyces TaxID=1883 RepID=UPI0033962041
MTALAGARSSSAPGEVPLPLRLRVRSGRIEAFMDGRPVIHVTDTRYARGRIGLNVFGGRIGYQGTFVRAP